jgi:hypothetical protein
MKICKKKEKEKACISLSEKIVCMLAIIFLQIDSLKNKILNKFANNKF